MKPFIPADVAKCANESCPLNFEPDGNGGCDHMISLSEEPE